MQKDSILNIILVGVGLCIVCGAVISTVAVSLRDQQEQNVIFDQQSKIIDAAKITRSLSFISGSISFD
jgi:Na+-transporting NADH:ubiquinone oxidoreductase subunit NqrC